MRERREEGQILAIFAGSILVLLLIVGLVIDAGFAWAGRRDAQNVSDLAAMAGTRALAEEYIDDDAGTLSGPVYAEVDESANANGCTAASGCTWTAAYVNAAHVELGPVASSGSVPSGAVGVKVDVQLPTDTIIVGNVMRLLQQGSGIDTWDVRTTATARTGSMTEYAGAGQLLPIAFLEPADGLKTAVEYEMTDEELDAPGSFGWLSWTGSNAATTLENSVCTPDNLAFTLPTWIDSSPGAKNMGGASGDGIKGCLEYYMENNIPVLIPIYGTGCTGTSDPIRGEGTNTEYCIVGIAVMQISDLNWAPVVKSIKGYFLRTFAYSPDSIPPGVTIGPPSAGDVSYFLSLVR